MLSVLFAEVTVELAINLGAVQLYYGCLSPIQDLVQTVEKHSVLRTSRCNLSRLMNGLSDVRSVLLNDEFRSHQGQFRGHLSQRVLQCT